MKNKFAIIGTSCSGKTTAVYNIVGRLRKEGYHIEGIISSDRIYPFDQSKLDTMEEAQAYVILQQALLEVRNTCRDDVQVTLSDRSVIDFAAYYMYCFPKPSFMKKAILAMVDDWAKSYDGLFYLEPLPYVSDGKRPTDQFRLNVDKIIRKLVLKHNVIKITGDMNERENKIYAKIKSRIPAKAD